jgi:hypothetical protein
MVTVTKTVIATIVSGHPEYISGQSTRADNKFLPQLNKDISEARDFLSREGANLYLHNVHNPFHRVFQVLEVEVNEKKVAPKKAAGVGNILLFLVIASMLLTSCISKYAMNPDRKYGCPHKSIDRKPFNK